MAWSGDSGVAAAFRVRSALPVLVIIRKQSFAVLTSALESSDDRTVHRGRVADQID
jgi:hypothetical protein